MCHDNWVKIAMADDSLVVNLLLRLQHAPPLTPPPSLNLQWSVRQRRSKCVPRHNKAEPTRASPTTPLSWSATTSASEESTRPTKHPHTSRSKVANNPTETVITKKSRRKKTLAELKEEENLLLKERRSLKNELASLRLTVQKHRATNESLKRLKVDLESHKKGVLYPTQCHPSTSLSPKTVVTLNSYVCPLNNSCSKSQESTLVLPDLNLPVDEDLSSNCMH